MCANKHSFTRKFDVLYGCPSKLELDDLWCVKCHNFYYKCLEKAQQNNAEVLSKIYDKGHLRLRCRFGHDFTISPQRNPNTENVWCSKCKLNHRNSLKQSIKDDIKRKEEEMLEAQKKLFSQVATET